MQVNVFGEVGVNLLEKDRNGSGGSSSCRIWKLLDCDFGQQTPRGCGGGAVFPEPSAFSLRHRFPTQCPFGSEASLFKLAFPAGQNANRTAVMRQCARRLPGKMNKVTQPVLCVLQFRPVPQPFPIQVRVRFQDPRQRFNEPRVEVAVHHGAQNDFGWITRLPGPHMLKAGVAKRSQLVLKVIGSARLNGQRFGKW